MTQESHTHQKEPREKEKKNSNWHDHITMLTTYYSSLRYKKELASGQGSQRNKVLKAQTHANAKAGQAVPFQPRYEWVQTEWGEGGRREENNCAAALASTKADLFLGLIKNPLKRKYWGNSPIFTTCYVQLQRTCNMCKWQHIIITVADIPFGIHQIYI